MNGIDEVICDDLRGRLSACLTHDATHLVGPAGIKGPAATTRALRRIVDRLNSATPAGCRLTAWFTMTKGNAPLGQIAIDTGATTPAVVWTLGAHSPELTYQSPAIVTFDSMSDQLAAKARPAEVLLRAPCGTATADMVAALRYRPVLTSFDGNRIRLQVVPLITMDITS